MIVVFLCIKKQNNNTVMFTNKAGSPPDGPDRWDADGGRLAVVQPADRGLEELLDELRRHGCREATGGPQSPAEQERRRRWTRDKHKRQQWRPR